MQLPGKKKKGRKHGMEIFWNGHERHNSLPYIKMGDFVNLKLTMYKPHLIQNKK